MKNKFSLFIMIYQLITGQHFFIFLIKITHIIVWLMVDLSMNHVYHQIFSRSVIRLLRFIGFHANHAIYQIIVHLCLHKVPNSKHFKSRLVLIGFIFSNIDHMNWFPVVYLFFLFLVLTIEGRTVSILSENFSINVHDLFLLQKNYLIIHFQYMLVHIQNASMINSLLVVLLSWLNLILVPLKCLLSSNGKMNKWRKINDIIHS